MSARERLHRLVEELPEETLDTAVRFLEFLKTQVGQEEDDEIATAAEDELEEVTGGCCEIPVSQ